jgi:sortase A
VSRRFNAAYEADLIRQHEKLAQAARKQAKNKVLAKHSTALSQDQLDTVTKQASKRNAYADKTIGVLYVPRLSVSLPIYNSSEEKYLTKGAAWIKETDPLPSGIDKHTVLTSHSGVPTAELFTNLYKMKKKDQFFILQNGIYYCYEVFRIQTVSPYDNQVLDSEAGQDLVSLLTCTPYMINTHRLVVTGKKIPFVPKMHDTLADTVAAKNQKNLNYLYLLLGIVATVALAIGYMFYLFLLSRRRYQLLFKIAGATSLDNQRISFQLFVNAGKIPILKKGQPIILVADKTGRIQMNSLPGRRYQLKLLCNGKPMTNGFELKLKPKLRQSFLVFSHRRQLMRKKIELTEVQGIVTIKLPTKGI